MGAETFTAIGAILGGLGAVVGAVKSFNTPKISIPNISLPQEDWNKINAAVEANKQLSDTAKQTIQQALSLYNQGKLTPSYQAKLDEWWQKASTSLEQTLAAQGLSNSTIAETARQALLTRYTSLYGDMLLKQLSDALQLTGISQEYYNQLMQTAQLKLNQNLSQAQIELQRTQLQHNIASQKGDSLSKLLGGMGQMASGFGGVFGSGTTGTDYAGSLARTASDLSKSESIADNLPFYYDYNFRKWAGTYTEPNIRFNETTGQFERIL